MRSVPAAARHRVALTMQTGRPYNERVFVCPALIFAGHIREVRTCA
jgi:hypothetical protein